MSIVNTSEPFRAKYVATGSIDQAADAFFAEAVQFPHRDLIAASRQLKSDLLHNDGPWLAPRQPHEAPGLSLDTIFKLTQAYGRAAKGSARHYAELSQLFLSESAPSHGRTLGEAATALGLANPPSPNTPSASPAFRPRRSQEP